MELFFVIFFGRTKVVSFSNALKVDKDYPNGNMGSKWSLTAMVRNGHGHSFIRQDEMKINGLSADA